VAERVDVTFQRRILKPGRNCWRIRRARRLTFLIDGAEYFRILYHALRQAEQQVLVLSWDVYSRLKLLSSEEGEDCPELSDLMNELVGRHEALRVYVLNWDFSVFFALSREWLPIYRLDWATDPRVRFQMDDECPIGSSHHQKVVVIDDALAFAGGLDLTRGRWDTPQHKPRDKRRLDIDGSRGRPYHDVQLAVSGPAAQALGDLARERWRRATGEALPRPPGDNPVWPEQLQPDLENVEVAIVRTAPAHGDYSEVREVQQLNLDAIASARSYIYIENQYFTARTIADALAARLAEPDGPEVIVSLPLRTDGWVANLSMDVIRVELIGRLRQADRHGRFAVYYPHLPYAGDPVNLHAKLMIVDDRFVRVGSSNLNNRSLGLDTECDLAFEAKAEHDRIEEAIRGFRNRLIGEHMAMDYESFDAAVRRHGALIPAIESLRGPGRSLYPLEPELEQFHSNPLSDAELMDPERPVSPEALLDQFVPEQETRSAGRRILGRLLAVVAVLGLAALWRFTDLSEWLDPELLGPQLERFSHSPLTAPVLIAVFVIAGFLLVPVTALITATLVAFGPLHGSAYAFAGSVASALAGYAVGASLGRRSVRRLAGRRLNAVSRRLAKRGLLAVLVVRVVPVAPFTVINLVAGASHISLRDFTWGTILGMAPGVAAIALLVDRAAASLRDPDWINILILVLVAAGILLGGYLLSRQLLARSERATGEPVDDD
jgi:phospholipase D1/2